MTNPMIPTTQSLPIALLRARERVMGPIRQMLADVGITEQQWRVLRVLTEGGAMEPTRIADEACLLLPSLTRILQKLEENGYIERQPDKKDRRKQVVTIRDKGRDIIEANLGTSIALTNDVRNRLGEERFDALLDLLQELDRLGQDQ